MLIRFSVENFLSFKDKVVFSMIPGKGTLKPNHKTSAVKGISALKTAVIFGANASGKSNLIKAIDFGRRLVLNGTTSEKPITFQNFRLDSETKFKNSRIEFEIQHKNKNYAYGFVFNNKEVVEEWLYEVTKKKDVKIFDRLNSKFDLEFLIERNREQIEKQFIEFTAKGTPNNQLFLTEIKTRKMAENVTSIEALLDVRDWFQNTLSVFYPDSNMLGIEFELMANTNLQSLFVELLEYFDTGIEDIGFEEIDFDNVDLPFDLKQKIKTDLSDLKSDKKHVFVSNKNRSLSYFFSKQLDRDVLVQKLMTKHKITGSDEQELFDLSDESDGTRRVIDFIPLIIDLLKGDNVFLVDEMERSLHPNLIYDLFDLFLEKSQNLRSQLIVASHESSLLTQKLLRKDEIWFVVKKKDGSSHLHSLEEYKIRFDKNIRKDYLLGRFKAIPRIGNRNELTVLPVNKFVEREAELD
jgi:AAA15 family ATPase/GTPase